MSNQVKIDQLKALYQKGVEQDKAGTLSDSGRQSMQNLFNVYGTINDMSDSDLQSHIDALSQL